MCTEPVQMPVVCTLQTVERKQFLSTNPLLLINDLEEQLERLTPLIKSSDTKSPAW